MRMLRIEVQVADSDLLDFPRPASRRISQDRGAQRHEPSVVLLGDFDQLNSLSRCQGLSWPFFGHRERFIHIPEGCPEPRALEHGCEHQHLVINRLGPDRFKTLHLKSADVPSVDTAKAPVTTDDLFEVTAGGPFCRHRGRRTSGRTKFHPLGERLIQGPLCLVRWKLVLAQLLEEVVLIVREHWIVFSFRCSFRGKRRSGLYI